MVAPSLTSFAARGYGTTMPYAYLIIVTAGLDPAVHADERKQKRDGESRKRQLCMDCRVKPGNDDGERIVL
jgi:hypothetical protein